MQDTHGSQTEERSEVVNSNSNGQTELCMLYIYTVPWFRRETKTQSVYMRVFILFLSGENVMQSEC